MRPIHFIAAVLLSAAISLAGTHDNVQPKRLPDGGVQPQIAVAPDGGVHVVYLQGDPKHTDVFYIHSSNHGESFSKPIRVNSQPGSAVAMGAIRGAQIAVGKSGRIHIVWNGSSIAQPRGPLNPEMPAESPHNGLPMLYSRLGTDGQFEPQRNLMLKTYGLDGGGSVAADRNGNVYVAWHAKTTNSPKGEAGRRVWLARSVDDGKTFAEERSISDPVTGACSCCGMRIFVDSAGTVMALYRSAREIVNRDIYLLASTDQGENFRGKMIHPWKIGACPVSSMEFVEGKKGVLAAWETEEQVFFSKIDPKTLTASDPVAAPGATKGRKYPVLAQNEKGQTLLLWSKTNGWGKPVDLHWSLAQADGTSSSTSDEIQSLPPWSFGAAIARPDGGFVVLY